MKNNSYFRAGAIAALATVLLQTAAWAQPVVQVPPGCNVVVTGTGTGVALGPGGVVGSGGIVIMPDPYAGDDFFLIPNATTVTGWGLAGDLSVQTGNPPGSPVQFVAGPASPVNIMSFNENPRPSETTPPSTSTLARSKGRVTISYNSPGCNSSIQFDVYKEYPNTGSGPGYVPPIVGPECWLPDTIYTYSVDHIASDNLFDGIGTDQYYWYIQDAASTVLPPGSFTTYYNSADNSSITFNAPNPLNAPYTLTCCYGRANPWDGNTLGFGAHVTCVTKTIGGQPTAPSITIPSCLNTGITSFNASVTPVPGYTYVWSSTNINWILTPSGVQGENLNVTAIGDQPGVIELTISYGGCTPVTFSYPVERQFTAPLPITGLACVNAGSVNNYTIPATALSNVTCWTVPTGWTYTNANGAGSSINLTVPPGTPAGAYVISARSCACPAGVINFTVNVRPATPTIVAGPTCVTRNGGGPQVWTSTASPGATGYTWGIPSGWNCVSCTGTNGIIIPGGVATGPVNLTVTAVGTNGCNATSSPYVVNYNPITPNSINVNCWNFGIAGNTQVTVANAPSLFYGTYNVSVAPAGLVSGYSVSATGVITLTTTAGAPAGSYTVSISHVTTSCGSSPVVNFPVTYGGNGATIAAYYDPTPTGSDVYIVSGAPGGATFSWYLDGVLDPGSTASFLGLSDTIPPAPTQVCAYVAFNGCTTVVCAPGGTHSRMMGPENGSLEEFAPVEVFPNPNNGTFTINIPTLRKQVMMTMVDTKGRVVGSYKVHEGNNRINTSNIAAGMYYLLLERDGKAGVHKVQIMNE